MKNNSHSRNLILRMAGWNRNQAGRPCTDPRHKHDLWSLDLCTEGEIQIEVESRKYPFKRGDIMLIAPGQNHRFMYGTASFSCYSFKFDLISVMEGLEPQTVYAGHLQGLKKRLAITEAVGSCLHGFCPEELLKKPHSFAISESFEGVHILESLLYGIMCHYLSGEAGQSPEISSDSLLSRISAFVCLRGGRPVTVEELAEHLHYSTGHLRFLVRKHTNMSTKQFIDLERIRIMKEMLRCSDIRIKELAGIMQFQDVKYFTRFFRKYTLETPREFLRRQKQM